MKVEVLVSQWAWEGGTLPAGEHDVEDPDEEFLRAAASAESVGSILVNASSAERGRMRSAIESDAASVKKQDAAIAKGDWQVGNLGDFVATKKALLARHADEEDELELPEDQALALEVGVAQAESILEKVEAGASYDDAVTEVLASG